MGVAIDRVPGVTARGARAGGPVPSGLAAMRTLLKQGDPGYDQARTVWNAIVDRRPRIIVRCAGAGEMVTAVRAARDLGLEIGVRCGGHSVLVSHTGVGGLTLGGDGLAGPGVRAGLRQRHLVPSGDRRRSAAAGQPHRASGPVLGAARR